MKIHSNIITADDIVQCVPLGCHLAEFHNRFGRTRAIDWQKSRSHEYGWIVRLSGTSKHTMDTRNLVRSEKAATWEEWGNFIAALYDIDNDAKVGIYKSAKDFTEKTHGQFPIRPRVTPLPAKPEWIYGEEN